MLADIPIVVLDTETTGLNPAMGHRIVELGAVRLENWQVVAEVSQLIQPERRMDPKASTVNGITDMDLQGQPTFAQIASGLLALLNGALVVAHNAAFDAAFLGQELFISGLALAGQRPSLANPWLCTLTLARNFFHFGSNSLSNIALELGVRMGQAHRALNDVYMTAAILQRMAPQLEQKLQLRTVGDLLHAQGGPIYTPPPPAPFLPTPIQDALQNRRQLHILYIDARGGQSNRVITPLYPTELNGTGYLVAHCHQKDEQRTFRLDRIFSARIV
ncbi:MAG: WYL domain-containing protein [Anaerolineales bacterium]|nr:WYL domain-containing protein [Anaerolineales bacterium]